MVHRKVPIVLCQWKRTFCLPQLLLDLQRQTIRRRPQLDIVLYIVNNNGANPNVREEIDRAVSRFGETESPFSIEVEHSETNAYGFARFLRVQSLIQHAKGSSFSYVFFIDDDYHLPATLLEEMWDLRQPRTAVCTWGRKFVPGKSYWQGSWKPTNTTLDYGGTGGMVIDGAIFRDSLIYQCPLEYRNVEDLWLSYVLSRRGWMIVHFGSLLEPFAGTQQRDALWTTLYNHKNAFLELLRTEYGWNV